MIYECAMIFLHEVIAFAYTIKTNGQIQISNVTIRFAVNGRSAYLRAGPI